MRRLDPNTIKYTNCTCRILGRRNRHAGTTPSSATPLPATSLSATHSFVALSSATVWGLSALVFTATARIVIPNVMRRPALNTIKYTNCTCRILGRRNRHAGTTPSSAVVRPPFTLRRSYRRRHRLVSFSSKSFRFGDAAALPIRFPRSVTDEYWHVASAARSGAAERRVGAAVQRGMRRGAGIDPLFFRTAGSSRETPSFGKPLRRLSPRGPKSPPAEACRRSVLRGFVPQRIG